MKTECLDNFYKDLDKEINKEYCIKIKDLIDADKLDPETLAQLIEEEFSKWFPTSRNFFQLKLIIITTNLQLINFSKNHH